MIESSANGLVKDIMLAVPVRRLAIPALRSTMLDRDQGEVVGLAFVA